MFGVSLRRKEDPRLITGKGTYVDDVRLPGMAYAAILRSTYAHARIKSINLERVKKDPRTVVAITGRDLAKGCESLPVIWTNIKGLKVPAHVPLPTDKVRYVGEPVCAVVAADRYEARDLLDMIEVDYEPLPAVSDPEKAMEKGSPLVHEEWDDNVAYAWNQEVGDVETAFKDADAIVSSRFVNQRLAPVAIEPRGVIAQYEGAMDQLTIWSSTQIPHIVRSHIARMFDMPEIKVRVIAPEVGGAFGSKLNVYAEEAIVSALAMETGRPVKWIEERRENMLSTIHGRDQVEYIEAAAKKDGTILGLKAKIISDLGAYHHLHTPGMAILTALMLPGVYRIRNIRTEVYGAFTNKMSTDAYRGAGRPEATYMIERIVDRVARKLKMDPAEVRRKNLIPPNEFPYQTATGLTYDSGDYVKALDRALKMIDYSGWREEQKRLRKEGKYIGLGISTYVEICGMGPSTSMPAGGWESAIVSIKPDGKVLLLTGSSPHGQGEETTFAQMVGAELGVPEDHVGVVHGDTLVVPTGVGTFGSRTTVVGGTAAVLACRKLKEKAQAIAAAVLKADASKVEFKEGKFFVEGQPDKFLTIRDVAREAHLARNIPRGMEPGLMGVAYYEPENFTYPFGAHICLVEVDGETGEVKIRKYVAVDDCGPVINPMLVEGQIHGGFAQGMAQALYEELIYDEDAQLLTSTLMEYYVPTACEVPPIETDRTETPAPNELGIKGVGEASTIGSTPAIMNAVEDALSTLGVQLDRMPAKPETVWRAIHRK